jgi:iron complex transport system ATP-binding protein
MLKIEDVSCIINGRVIVKDVTFTVRPGELVAILGANGAGKSTLMRMMSGERMPDKGEIRLDDKLLGQYDRQQIAMRKATLTQHNNMTMDFLCQEIVMMGRYPYHNNRPTQHDSDIVAEAMEACGVSHLEERSYPTLSGGEQQRIQLARTLAQLWDQPGGLILLDEPLGGLDILYQQQTLAIMKAFAQKGFMIVAVLHEINLAAQYASRMILMKNGRRWCDGTPCEVLTPLNIYSVFSIQADVMTNPFTLQPYLVAKEIMIRTEQFNSKLPHTTGQQSDTGLEIEKIA